MSGGEDGFAAQDERPFGIQGGDEAELGRLAELEERLAAVGLDLFGGPLV